MDSHWFLACWVKEQDNQTGSVRMSTKFNFLLMSLREIQSGLSNRSLNWQNALAYLKAKFISGLGIKRRSLHTILMAIRKKGVSRQKLLMVILVVLKLHVTNSVATVAKDMVPQTRRRSLLMRIFVLYLVWTLTERHLR